MTCRQIYHTSHCGSTVLAVTLAQDMEVYAEPDWAHRPTQGYEEFFLSDMKRLNETAVVKLPSATCVFAPQSEGKKVFIYRNLKPHLRKMVEDQLDYQVSQTYWFALTHIHPSLRPAVAKAETYGHQHTILWANKVLWALEADQMLRVPCNDFFADPVSVVSKIHKHFGHTPTKPVERIAFDVKDANLNNKNEPLHTLIGKKSGREVPEGYGTITEKECVNDEELCYFANWLTELVPSVPLDLI